jgi:hypothetical protein
MLTGGTHGLKISEKPRMINTSNQMPLAALTCSSLRDYETAGGGDKPVLPPLFRHT